MVPSGGGVPHQPSVLPYEGLPPLPIGLTWQRLRPDVPGSRPVHRPGRAAADASDAGQPRDDVPAPFVSRGGVSRSAATGGAGIGEPADLADAPAVIGCHGRVRTAHPGASTPRPRMTPGSAPCRAGVRMFPDMSLPVCCSDRPFPGQVDRSADHVNP